MFDQPIQLLSPKEAAERKASSNGTPPLTQDDSIRLGRRIWQMVLAGNNRDQMAERLKIPVELLDETLYQYRLRLGLSIDHYRLADNERLDRLLLRWLPVALNGPITIQKIKAGEVFSESDFDRPLEAGKFVLQLLDKRAKILGATAQLESAGGTPGSIGAKEYGERQIVIWLREVMPSIEKITRELEVETNADSTRAD
jgi:hypothetical protein